MPTVLIVQKAQEQRLANADIESQVCEKGTRGKPLTEEQKLSNRTKCKSQSPSRTCVWCTGGNGWAFSSHHRFATSQSQNWFDEFSVQHEAFDTVD